MRRLQQNCKRKELKVQRGKRFEELSAPICKAEGVQEMHEYCHHGSVSTYDHCLRVARCAFKMSCAIPGHYDDVAIVRAGILHDYFGYDWHCTDNSKHAVNHPVIALERAKEEFDLSPLEQNIISAHMWPLPPTRMPKSAEAWLVCLADKICALQETITMR